MLRLFIACFFILSFVVLSGCSKTIKNIDSNDDNETSVSPTTPPENNPDSTFIENPSDSTETPLDTAGTVEPTTPEEELHPSDPILNALSRRYPYFNVRVAKFVVFDYPLNPEIINPSIELMDNRAKITPEEKKYMLHKLDLVRFIINTPEFEKNFFEKEYWADKTRDWGQYPMEKNKPLNKNRYFEIIKNRKYAVIIAKTQVSMSAVAKAELGASLYIWKEQNELSYHIMFPNRYIWNQYSYSDAYMAGSIFHEMLHNMGLDHLETTNYIHDPVHVADEVLSRTYNDAFRIKYAKELAEFVGFYEKLHADMLNFTTVPDPSPFTSQRNRSNMSTNTVSCTSPTHK